MGPDPNPRHQCLPQGEAGDLAGRVWQVGEGRGGGLESEGAQITREGKSRGRHGSVLRIIKLLLPIPLNTVKEALIIKAREWARDDRGLPQPLGPGAHAASIPEFFFVFVF